MSKTLAFFICVFLWFMVGLGVIFAPEAINAFWESVRELPWWLEGAIWLLTLPWMIGLWIWQSPWDLWLRFLLVVGVALANLVSFNSWTQNPTPVASTPTGADQRESHLTKV